MKYKTFIAISIIIFLLAAAGCRQRTSTDFNALSEHEKDVLYLRAQGYPVITPETKLARADSALAADRNAYTYFNVSTAHWLLGNVLSSLRFADSALAVCGSDAVLRSRIHLRRAAIYGVNEEPEKERREYRTIIGIGQDEYVHDAEEGLAESFFMYGNYKEALAALPDSLSFAGEWYKQLILDALGLEPRRIWKPVLASRYVYPAPSEVETDSWSRGLQAANPVDTISREQLKMYGSVRRYLAVHDFYQAWYGKYRSGYKNNHRITEWRLLQYDTSAFVRRSARDKVIHLKEVYEDILDFEPQNAEDTAMKEKLTDEFTHFYDYTMDYE